MPLVRIGLVLAGASAGALPGPAAPVEPPLGRGHARVTVDGDGPLRAYTVWSDAPLRDHLPEDGRTAVAEVEGRARVRSASTLFDALYALAVQEAHQDSVGQIRDYAYGRNEPLAIEAFQTGEKWTYVWTRDLSYSADLAMAGFDPARAATSLRFKASDTKASVAGGWRRQIIQDTGSGGSYPVSSDRIVWALGADAVARALPEPGRSAFVAEAYACLRDTIEQDRRLIFDPVDGLYRGEQSFLDWREQTYPAWTGEVVLPIGLSKALSVNAAYVACLDTASRYAGLLGRTAERDRYASWAASLRGAVRRGFYDPAAGLFSTVLLSDGGPPVRLHRYDLLGESLAILHGVATPAQADAILHHYPVGPHGPAVVWPQERTVPIYHNQAIWPFVTAYWMRAARAAGCVEIVDLAVRQLADGAAMNLSNMENFDFVTGLPEVRGGAREGPVVNSRRQLWSVAAYLAMVQEGVFGVETGWDGVSVRPLIGAATARLLAPSGGTVELRDYPYQGARVTVRLHIPPVAAGAAGACPVVSSVLNGRDAGGACVPRGRLGADNLWEVTLGPPPPPAPAQPLRVVDPAEERAAYGPAQPLWDGAAGGAEVVGGRVVLHFRAGDATDARFVIYRNGEPIGETRQPGAWADDNPRDVGYYVIGALDAATGTASHLTPSRRVALAPPLPAIPASALEHQGGVLRGGTLLSDWGAPGDTITAPRVEVPAAGLYALRVRYSNGAGPINTGIACGVKRLEVMDPAGTVVAAGYLVMPQLGDAARIEASSAVFARLRPGTAYRAVLREDDVSRNMSYMERNTRYTNWPGGGDQPYNRVGVAAVLIEAAPEPLRAPVP